MKDQQLKDKLLITLPRCPHMVEKNSSGWWCNEKLFYPSVVSCYNCHFLPPKEEPKVAKPSQDLRRFFQ